MSLFNTIMPGSNQFSLIFDEIELKRNITKYINRVKKSAWYYNCNHIFISPGNSFNVKYFIKVLFINYSNNNYYKNFKKYGLLFINNKYLI